MPVGSIAEKAAEEVRALHAFFVDWLRGTDGPAIDFAVCEAVLAPDFRLVNPNGAIHDRAATLKWLLALRGTAAADFTIETLQPRAVWQSADAVLLEYVERQYRDGRTTTRQSTALFTAEPKAPRGVVWRHLQETWISP